MCVCQWSDFFLQLWNRIGWIMLTSMVPAAPRHHHPQKKPLAQTALISSSTCILNLDLLRCSVGTSACSDFLWREASHDESIFGWFWSLSWFFGGYSTMKFHVGYNKTTCFFSQRLTEVSTCYEFSAKFKLRCRHEAICQIGKIFPKRHHLIIPWFFISHGKISMFFLLPSSKLTWQWKTDLFKMYSLLNLGDVPLPR